MSTRKGSDAYDCISKINELDKTKDEPDICDD